MVLKKKISTKQADKIRRKNSSPEEQESQNQQADIKAIIKETIEQVTLKSLTETTALVAAIKNIKPASPEVKVVQNAAPQIKSIKVTNISRCSKGFIKDMDMKVERDSIH